MARWRRYPGWSLRRAGVLIASLCLELDLVGFERFLVIEIVGTMTSSIAFVHENELLNNTPPPRFVMPGCTPPEPRPAAPRPTCGRETCAPLAGQACFTYLLTCGSGTPSGTSLLRPPRLSARLRGEYAPSAPPCHTSSIVMAAS
jgi:hypothetical protein